VICCGQQRTLRSRRQFFAVATACSPKARILAWAQLAADGVFEVGDAGEGAAPDGLPGEDPEEDLNQVRPGAAGRGEMQRDPWVAAAPPSRSRGRSCRRARAVSLADGPCDLLEDRQEPGVGVPLETGISGDLAGGDLEGSTQRGGAVALVLVVRRSARPSRSGGLGWVRSSAWIWDLGCR
jgi:hypothetical protein